MSAIYTYGQWIDIVDRGTSGDQVMDILESWKVDAYKLLEDNHKLESRIAELEAERRWIPVSEKPTKSDWYLIMYQGYRVPDAGYYDVEAGWLSDIPDCWMPLPEPPEVK